MPSTEFQQRAAALKARHAIGGAHQTVGAVDVSVKPRRVKPVPKTSKRGKNFLFGMFCSGIVFALFWNAEVISDLAPASVKQSNMPGLFIGVIAIVAFGWISITCIWFTVSACRASLSKWQRSPNPFAFGAFVGIGFGLGAMYLLKDGVAL